MQQLIERQVDVETGEIALTTPELEARVWDTLVEQGRVARADHDDTNWRVGRLAVKAAEMFAVDRDGNPIDQKVKFVLKKFAVEIGMIDNPRYIYDLHNTAAFWSESAQAHFKDCTWSAFRETARHNLTIDRASAIMHLHGHEPVGKIREIIVGKPPEPEPPEPDPWAELDTFTCPVAAAADRLREAMVSLDGSEIVKVSIYIAKGE